MKRLEQEAQEYFDNNIFCDGITPFEEDISKRCFIAGANSNYVQAEKIKAQIEIIKRAESLLDLVSIHRELQQQLKQLEDENDTIQT